MDGGPWGVGVGGSFLPGSKMVLGWELEEVGRWFCLFVLFSSASQALSL